MGGDTGRRHVGSCGLRAADLAFEKWPARPKADRSDRFPMLPATGFIRLQIVSMVFLAQRQNVPFRGLSVMEVTRPHILLYSAQKQSRHSKKSSLVDPQ